jgi:hypothetical protein
MPPAPASDGAEHWCSGMTRGMCVPVPLLLQQQHQADREDGVDAGKLRRAAWRGRRVRVPPVPHDRAPGLRVGAGTS